MLQFKWVIVMDAKNIGNFIYKVREHNNIKQEMLAYDVKISRTVLSRIENGVSKTNTKIITSLCTQLGFEYSEYEENKHWIYSQFEMIYKSIIFGNQKYEFFLNEVELKAKDKVYLTFYPEYSLIKMIVAYRKNEFEKFCNLIETCSTLEPLFDNFEHAIYLDYLALRHTDTHFYNESLKILNSVSLVELPDYLCGMIKYHIGFNYNYTKNYYMSIKNYENALDYFMQAQNFNKIIYTQICISGVLFKSGNYQMAIVSSLKTLDAAHEILNDNYILYLINSNIAWYYLVCKEYPNTIKYVENALKYNPNATDCYFYLAFSYYEMNDNEKALHFIELAEEVCNNTDFDYRMCIAVKKIIKKSHNLINYLTNLYETIDDCQYPTYKKLVLEFIIMYYKDTKDYKNLAKYSLLLNEFLSNNTVMCTH